MKNFRLLIHHHAVAYLDDDNHIHVPSFIGRWINALAPYVSEIGLLFSESEILELSQDETIYFDNVKLWSLGAPGKTWDRISRIKRLRSVCIKASEYADGLLIRGITPRQMDVWNAISVKHKAYLLVGSLLQTKPKFKPTFWGIYEQAVWRWRRAEFIKITKDGILMANSPLLVEELASLHRKATFVPTNSICMDEFAPFYIRQVSQPRKILFCGRVVVEKGIQELIHAVSQLNVDQIYKLDIVGPVSVLFRRECEQLIRNLNIFDKVEWHGHIPYGDNLFSFYRQADVFVLPSYYEGFPHVIWESAANCCPVITSRVGGVPALWKDKQYGMLIEPRNALSIVTAINTLFGDENLRKTLIEKAYYFAQDFTVESCGKSLVDMLQKSGWNM
jgi:glycosyltransferase involved in cell wall biosynthesis